MDMTQDIQIGSYYRHYKGNVYKVIGLALHTETGEMLVLYKTDTNGCTYARPRSMWFDRISENLTRFTPITPAINNEENSD